MHDVVKNFRSKNKTNSKRKIVAQSICVLPIFLIFDFHYYIMHYIFYDDLNFFIFLFCAPHVSIKSLSRATYLQKIYRKTVQMRHPKLRDTLRMTVQVHAFA